MRYHTLRRKVQDMLLEWTDDYSIGIGEIDEQHQSFFEAAHRLYNAILNVEEEQVVEEFSEGELGAASSAGENV